MKGFKKLKTEKYKDFKLNFYKKNGEDYVSTEVYYNKKLVDFFDGKSKEDVFKVAKAYIDKLVSKLEKDKKKPSSHYLVKIYLPSNKIRVIDKVPLDVSKSKLKSEIKKQFKSVKKISFVEVKK